jgi:hypothetical protein
MATYYWVGGTGTWNASSTTNWSASSGGAGSAGVPNSTDTVIFDSLSGTGTCTTDATAAAAIVTLDSATLGLTLGANFSMSGTFTLTSGALSLGNNDLTIATRLTNTGATARSIAFGTGKIILSGSSNTIYNAPDLTNFSYTGTGLLDCTYAGSVGTRTFVPSTVAGGTVTNALSVNISAGTDTVTLTSDSDTIFKNVDFTGFSGTFTNGVRRICGNLTISSGMTVSAGTGATTFIATSGTQQITTNGKTLDFPITQNGVGGTVQLQDNLTMGSTRTFTLTNGALDLNNLTLSTGLFSSNNTNTRSIAFGTGNITVTGNAGTVWNFLNLTGFTYTGTSKVNATYSGSTGTRAIYHGTSTGSGSSETKAININVTAGTDIVDMVNTGNLFVKNLDFTGFAGNLTDIRYFIYGNLTFSSGMTLVAATANTTFAGTGVTQNITTAGLTLDFPIVFDGVGSTFAFQDALTQGSTRAFTVTNGTVKLKAGFTSTVGAFATSGTNQKFLQSTTLGSTATLSQASGTVDASYLTIQDITAIGGATFNAFTDQSNVDAGNVEGWDFGISPIVGGAEYTYALRSLTEQRRF